MTNPNGTSHKQSLSSMAVHKVQDSISINKEMPSGTTLSKQKLLQTKKSQSPNNLMSSKKSLIAAANSFNSNGGGRAVGANPSMMQSNSMMTFGATPVV